jgi:RNA-directed DNA polymerase
MPEDAPVNTSAAGWPRPDAAYFTVREMQTKLHRRAAEDPGRRFGDLFNLVYDRRSWWACCWLRNALCAAVRA